MKKFKKLLVGLAIILVTVVATACSNNKAQGKTDSKPVRVGIIGADDKIWNPLVKRLADKGIKVKLVKFTNYDQPNQALASGDIDLNAYQHIYFLNNWNKAHHTSLKPIGNTVIGPLAVFSNKIKNISELKDGDTVTIPNDVTNQARALQLLENAKLITLKPGVKFPTPNDVASNKKNLKIKPLDATQTARSLDDSAAAIVNNDLALDAKLNYKDAIYLEKITKKSKIWVNVIVAQKKDAKNATYKKIVKAYQSKQTAGDIKATYKGSTIPAWNYKF